MENLGILPERSRWYRAHSPKKADPNHPYRAHIEELAQSLSGLVIYATVPKVLTHPPSSG